MKCETKEFDIDLLEINAAYSKNKQTSKLLEIFDLILRIVHGIVSLRVSFIICRFSHQKVKESMNRRSRDLACLYEGDET